MRDERERNTGADRHEGAIRRLVERLGHLPGRPVECPLVDVTWDGAHSNDVFSLRFADGRVLMLKRGRHDWADQSFVASARAARLVDGLTGIVVPRPIPLPDDLDERPLQAYWRIPHPTLDGVWDRLGHGARASALRSWGRLIEELHGVRVEGWGPLTRDGDGVCRSLPDYLERDLGGRLLPAAYGIWSEAVPALERLLERAPVLARRLDDRPPTLAHNDLHMGNVLCRFEGEEVRCVGLLDLDAAVALPRESDAASLDVLHGPLFEQHLSARWRDAVWDGYAPDLDPWARTFFRALHLGNLGIHSAILAHHEHADAVAGALTREVRALDRGTRGDAAVPHVPRA